MKKITIREFIKNIVNIDKETEILEITRENHKTRESKTIGYFTPISVNGVSSEENNCLHQPVIVNNDTEEKKEEIKKEYITCKKEGCFNLAIRNGFCSIH